MDTVIKFLATFLATWVGSMLIGAAMTAKAASWPERPIRLIVPFPPGGGGDLVARIVAARLSESLGQPCVVDNRTGASGNLGAEMVANSEPDGYTILLGFNTVLTVNPSLFRLQINMQTDLAPVVMLTSGLHMLVVHPSVKVGTVKELIALAKAKPDSLNYASSGAGSPANLAAELLKMRAGIRMTHVPYRGGGPAAVAILAGEVQVLFGSLPSVMPLVKEGRLKGLAVTSLQRTSSAPNVPTIAESGYPGFEVTNWHGLLVPKHTPAPVLKIIHDQAIRAIQAPDIKSQLNTQGLDISIAGPEEFATRIRNESAIWAKVVQTAGIKAE